MRAARYFAASVFLVAGVIAVAASPAHADELTECMTTTDFMPLHFDPGLDLTQTQTDYEKGTHDPTAPCTGGFGGTLTIDRVDGEGSLSCLLGTGISGSANLDWSDNTSSTMDITTVGPLPGSASKAIILNGTISHGKFDGQSVAIVITATVSFTPQCLAPGGLTEFNGTVSLTVLP